MADNEDNDSPWLRIFAILICIIAVVYTCIHDVPVLIREAMDRPPPISQTK